MLRCVRRSLAFILVFCCFHALSLASDSVSPKVWDLGRLSPGKVYPTTVSAANLSCPGRHTFSIEIEGAPWLTLNGPKVLEGISVAEERNVPAVVDLRNLADGEYRGRLTVRCLSCPPPPACSQNTSEIEVRVLVGSEAMKPKATPRPEKIQLRRTPESLLSQTAGGSQTTAYHCMTEVGKCTCFDPLDCWILGIGGLCQDGLNCLSGDLCTCNYSARVVNVPGNRVKPCGWLCRFWGKRVQNAGCSEAPDGTSHTRYFRVEQYRVWRGFGERVHLSPSIDGRCNEASEENQAFESSKARFSNLEIANPNNPFDAIGKFHNAGVDFIIRIVASRLNGQEPGREAVEQEIRRATLIWINRAVQDKEFREALGGSQDAVRLRTGLAGLAKKLPVGQSPQADGSGSSADLCNEDCATLAQTRVQVLRLLDGSTDYEAYQGRIRNLEAGLVENGRPKPRSAGSLSVLAIARYSAQFAESHKASKPFWKSDWWQVGSADVGGAYTGAKIGGLFPPGGAPAGAIIGGLMGSAFKGYELGYVRD